MCEKEMFMPVPFLTIPPRRQLHEFEFLIGIFTKVTVFLIEKNIEKKN